MNDMQALDAAAQVTARELRRELWREAALSAVAQVQRDRDEAVHHLYEVDAKTPEEGLAAVIAYCDALARAWGCAAKALAAYLD